MDASPLCRPSPTSPASSSSATADEDEIGSSPILPQLPQPTLPERALELLRTPPGANQGLDGRYVTTSWGSPYPQSAAARLRSESLSSDPSDDSPIHHLEIATPFLRPAPQFSGIQPQPSLDSAAVLANRARRPARGLTEDWIRQHTTGGLGSESQLWLSDGTDNSENSSLSGSLAGDDDDGWLVEADAKTPRAIQPQFPPRTSSRHPRTRSSLETLKQADLSRLAAAPLGNMTTLVTESKGHDTASLHSHHSGNSHEVEQDAATPSTPKRSDRPAVPTTPQRTAKKEAAGTPRLRKKVPWKGKNILILLPRDEERGLPGKAPRPLTAKETARLFQEWEQLGYDVRGFDLLGRSGSPDTSYDKSQSREAWPLVEEMTQERAERQYKVILPDLNRKHSQSEQSQSEQSQYERSQYERLSL